jgi:hypothetical protein
MRSTARVGLLAASTFVIMPVLALGQPAATGPEDDRAKLVKVARSLEVAPLTKDAPELRKWALT